MRRPQVCVCVYAGPLLRDRRARGERRRKPELPPHLERSRRAICDLPMAARGHDMDLLPPLQCPVAAAGGAARRRQLRQRAAPCRALGQRRPRPAAERWSRRWRQRQRRHERQCGHRQSRPILKLARATASSTAATWLSFPQARARQRMPWSAHALSSTRREQE